VLERTSGLLEIVRDAAATESFRAACNRAVDLAAEYLGASRALLSFKTGRGIRMGAISGVSRIDPASAAHQPYESAMREAARTYSKIRQMNIPIQYLDVGGGMAVDYDGSKTSFESSANYNAQEFANDVVYVIKTVCDDEDVPHPTIIQESGRYLSAYHAILVTNIQDEIETVVEDLTPITITADDPAVVKELHDLRSSINGKNYGEYYHDALENREELFTMFNLGLISLEARGKGEVLFWDVCERADEFAQQIVAFTRPFADPGEYREAAVLGGDVGDKFLNQNRFANARAAEQTDFSAALKRLNQVNDFDSRLEHFEFRRLFVKTRRVTMNRGSRF